jgi:glycine betaine/proline transport system substrate-binding protein
MPEVYEFLDRFSWSPSEMGRLMLWNREDKGLYPYEKALRWMRTHPERVRSWTP